MNLYLHKNLAKILFLLLAFSSGVNGQNCGSPLAQDLIKDGSLCAGETTNYEITKTNVISYIPFVKSQERYIKLNSLQSSLAGTNRSVFMWIKKHTNVSGSYQVLFSADSETGSGTISNFVIGTNEQLGIKEGLTIKNNAASELDNEWHYVGFTYNNTTTETKVWIDGVNTNTFTSKQGTTATSTYSLGQEYGRNLNTGNFFDGDMAEVSVWNEVLDVSDIFTAMNSKITATHPKYANLMGYYSFQSCADSSASLIDASVNGNNGSVVNFTLDNTLVTTIDGFNSIDWYTSYKWFKNGSVQSTASSYSTAADNATYSIELERDNVRITDSWTTTILENTEVIDENLNETICSNNEITYSPTTHKIAPFTFSKTDKRFVDLDVLNNDLVATDRSVFMWVKAPVDIATEAQVLFSINTLTGDNVSLLQINTAERLELYDGSNNRATTFDLGDDQWHYVGYTYNNTTNETKIYGDGQVLVTFTDDQSVVTTDRVSLGQEYDSHFLKSNFYDGLMTEVSIWKSVLTESDIQTAMNSKIENTHAKYANLVGYYSFPSCNDHGDVLKDWSTKNNDGTINGVGDITSTTVYQEIANFNSAGWFTKTWYKNNNEIGMNNTVSFWPFLGTDTYKLVLKRDFLELTDVWDLTYNANISTQPQDVSVHQGSDAIFNLNTVSGSTYQWYQKYDDDDYAFTNYGSTELGTGATSVNDVTVVNGVIYVATDIGVSVSYDNGQNWELWNISTKGLMANLCAKVAVFGDNIFIVHRTNLGSYSYSRDGGATFSTRTIYPVVSGTVNTFGNAIKIGNNSYQPIHFTFDTDGNVYAMAMAFSETGSSNVFAAAVIKSVDSGVTFSLLSHIDLGDSANYSAGLSEGDLVVSGTKILLSSGRDGFAFSNDSGATFQVFNSSNTIMTSSKGSAIDVYQDKVYLGVQRSNLEVGLYETDANGSYFTEILPNTPVNSLTIKDGKMYVFTKGLGAKIYDLNTQTFSADYISMPSNLSKMTNFNGKFYLYESNNGLYEQIYSKLLTGETASTLTISGTVAADNENKYLVEVSKDGCTNESNIARLFVKTGDIVKPLVQSILPLDDATGVTIENGMTFTIDFDENVVKGTGNILIRNTADKSYVATIDVSDSEVSVVNNVATIAPTNAQVTTMQNLIGIGQGIFYLEVPKEAFTDTNGNTFAGIIENQWDFAGAAISTTNIVINEILADPNTIVDANGDGIVSATNDQFVELVNLDTTPHNLNGFTISNTAGVQYTFGATTIPAGGSVVVFGGGTPTGIPGVSLTASGLSLSTTSDTVTLKNAADAIVATYTYNSEANDAQSIARNIDLTGGFSKHATIVTNPVTASPGRYNVSNIPFTVVTWKGTTNNDWHTASNWSSGTVPTSVADVQILKVTNQPTASAVVTVNSVVINSGASLIAENTFTGTVTYNRNIDTNWRLVSSPVSGETMTSMRSNNNFANGSGGNRIGFALYDNTLPSQKWVYYTTSSTDAIINGKGYTTKLASSGNITFTGTINTSNVSIKPVLGGASGGNYNLLGNPYTSYINSTTLITSKPRDLELTFWLWSGNGYNTKTTGVHPNFMIAPGQAFFVKAKTTSTITFDETIQSHNTTDTFQKSSRPEILLNFSDDTNNRNTEIYYIHGTTKGFDNGYDGKMFGGTSYPFAIYSHLISDSEGEDYAIQSLPNSDYENMVIPIGVNAVSGKQVTFSAQVLNLPTGIKLFLEDKYTNTFTRLDEATSTYKVTLTEAIHGIGRFYLHTKSSVLSTNEVNLENISIYKTNNSTLRIVGLSQGQSKVKLFNILGKQILQTSFTATHIKEISLPKLAMGVYFVELETEAGKLNKKIILE